MTPAAARAGPARAGSGGRLEELDASRALHHVEEDEPVAARSQFASAGIPSKLVLEWKIHCDVRPGPGSAVDVDRAAQSEISCSSAIASANPAAMRAR
jgi:hypothetical protein